MAKGKTEAAVTEAAPTKTTDDNGTTALRIVRQLAGLMRDHGVFHAGSADIRADLDELVGAAEALLRE